jgi:AraC-like DNA-binding protein
VGTLPLAEIALAVGFTNQVNFTHSFTRNEGISPRLWQRSHSASAL